jgi:polyhydroxyalkanoate synthesis regulator phasin
MILLTDLHPCINLCGIHCLNKNLRSKEKDFVDNVKNLRDSVINELVSRGVLTNSSKVKEYGQCTQERKYVFLEEIENKHPRQIRDVIQVLKDHSVTEGAAVLQDAYNKSVTEVLGTFDQSSLAYI